MASVDDAELKTELLQLMQSAPADGFKTLHKKLTQREGLESVSLPKVQRLVRRLRASEEVAEEEEGRQLERLQEGAQEIPSMAWGQGAGRDGLQCRLIPEAEGPSAPGRRAKDREPIRTPRGQVPGTWDPRPYPALPGSSRPQLGLRELLAGLEPLGVDEDVVLGSLFQIAPGLRRLTRLTPEDSLGRLFLLRALREYAAQEPPETAFVADLLCPRGPFELMQVAAMAQTELLDVCLKCLPLWTQLHSGMPLCWFLDTQCRLGLRELYADPSWGMVMDRQVDLCASVQHEGSGLTALWGSLGVVHQLSTQCAIARPGHLVVRVLRATGNELRKAQVRAVALAPCPANCLTLWVREDVLVTQGLFRPQPGGLPLDELLCDTEPLNYLAACGLFDGEAPLPARTEPLVNAGERRCSACGKVKPAVAFSKSQRAKGNEARCSACLAAAG